MTDDKKKNRILIASVGPGGHDRKPQGFAHVLREASMNRINTGLRQTLKRAAEAAPQQDVQFAGLPDLSSAPPTLVANGTRLLRQPCLNTVRAFLGRHIPAGDNPELRKPGVDQTCGPDLLTRAITITMQDVCQETYPRQVCKGINRPSPVC